MNIKVVYGCPCSGKSTYISERAGDKDLIFDYDKLIRAVTTRDKNLVAHHVAHHFVLDIRYDFINDASYTGEIETLWIACRWITDKLKDLLDGKKYDEIFIEATKEECYEHLDNDDMRPEKEKWRDIIDSWFEEHEEEKKKGGENKLMNKFWNWTTVNEERTLILDGTIAEDSWFDDDITPEFFRQELFAGTGPVTIWINSPGGDCFAASQIYAMLMEYKGNITVKIDGFAASAASVIAMAGTEVFMVPTAMMMIHNPATIVFGDHEVMEKAIDMLSEVKEGIINAYEIKTSLPRKQLSKMMDQTTWMNAKKAVELGFADSILKDEKLIPAAEAFEFSQRTVENAFVNKLTVKINLKRSIKNVDVADKEIENEMVGRRVDDLKAALYQKLL